MRKLVEKTQSRRRNSSGATRVVLVTTKTHFDAPTNEGNPLSPGKYHPVHEAAEEKRNLQNHPQTTSMGDRAIWKNRTWRLHPRLPQAAFEFVPRKSDSKGDPERMR